MNTIIAGRFDEQAAADAATHALEAAGFSTERISKFFVMPPGQHDVHGTVNDPAIEVALTQRLAALASLATSNP